MKSTFSILILFFLILSCSKKEEQVFRSGGVTISFIGASNIGKVFVGEEAFIKLKLTNETDKVIETPNLTPICLPAGEYCPFRYDRFNYNTNSGKGLDCGFTLAPHSTCGVSIRFAPRAADPANNIVDDTKEFIANIDPDGFNLWIRGEGVRPGYLSVTSEGSVNTLGQLVWRIERPLRSEALYGSDKSNYENCVANNTYGQAQSASVCYKLQEPAIKKIFSKCVSSLVGNGQVSQKPIDVICANLITAGTTVFKDFTIKNSGRSEIPHPVVSGDGFYIANSTCEDSLVPQKTCTITVGFSRTSATPLPIDTNKPYFNATLRFSSTANDFVDIETRFNIIPSLPSGEINTLCKSGDGVEVDCSTVRIRNDSSSNGDVKKVLIKKIPDEYGNKIITDEEVKISLSKIKITETNGYFPMDFCQETDLGDNCTPILCDDSSDNCAIVIQAKDGLGQFKIRSKNPINSPTNSTQIKSSARAGLDKVIQLDLGLGLSYKTLLLKPISGNPTGLTIKSFLPEVRVSSSSTVRSTTIQTDPIVDSNGRLIEDGTSVFFKIKNAALGKFSPIEAKTFQGIAYSKLFSPFTVGSDTVCLSFTQNGPCSSGDIVISYLPDSPNNNVTVSSLNKVIYFKNDPNKASPYSTEVVIGPIKDSNGNNVRSGHPVDIKITNGIRLGSIGLNQFTILTGESSVFTCTDQASDNCSIASFSLEAGGFVGDIKIEAEVRESGDLGELVIHSSSDKKIKYTKGSNDIRLYKTYASNTSTLNSEVLPSSKTWNRLYRPNSLLEVDGKSLGHTTYNSQNINTIKSIQMLSSNYAGGTLGRFSGYDCLQNIYEYTALFPCFYSLYYYTTPRAWGTDSFYSLGREGGLDWVASTRPPTASEMGQASNHGSYYTLYPTQFYIEESDSFYTYGGLQYNYTLNNGASPTYSLATSEVTSKYNGAQKVISNYDQISYERGSLVNHPGLSFSAVGDSELYGKFIYGGFKKPSVMSGYSLDSSVSRVYSDDNGSDKFETLAIKPDFNGNSPEPRIFPALYYDNETDDVYLVGGYRKVGFTYFQDRSVWKFNFKDQTKDWYRKWLKVGEFVPEVQRSPIYDPLLDLTSWSSDNTPANFDSIQNLFLHSYMYKSDDGNVYLLFTGAPKTSSLYNSYIIDLNLGVNSMAPAEINNLAKNSSSVRYNPYSGRLYAIEKDLNNQNTNISFYETTSDKKQYYLVRANLGNGTDQTVLDFTISLNAYSVGVTDNVYLFNQKTSKYELAGTVTNSNSQSSILSPTIINRGPSANPSNYVSSEGDLYMLITCAGNSLVNPNLKIDYVSIKGSW